MHYQRSIVTLVRLDRLVARSGFATPFHCATFELTAEGGMHSTVQVWVPAGHAEADVELAARRLLAHRLAELANVARGVERTVQPSAATPHGSRERPRIAKPKTRRGLSKQNIEGRLERLAEHEEPGEISLERYTLNGHEPVCCTDLPAWKAWMESPQRLIQETPLEDDQHNPVRVCTAFLGIDVSFGVGEPILFETMVLGGKWDRELFRYYTWEAAYEGHAAIVQCLKDGDTDEPGDIVLKARELARITVSRSRRVAVSSLVEHSVGDPQNVPRPRTSHEPPPTGARPAGRLNARSTTVMSSDD